jgi:antitoxin (DNA-binding transcriptional repressor) of toxin-antitoxin stability system
MGHHSVAEAKNNLSKLIDLALTGENVVITRHGHAVVEIKAVVETPLKRVTPQGLAMLDRLRVGNKPAQEDAATLVRRMRDEDWR